jgi:hypothetical protein
MRVLTLGSLLALAACGGEEGQNQTAQNSTDLQAGQWETTVKVTRFKPVENNGEPVFTAEEGSGSTASVCVGEDQVTRPPPELFAGEMAEGCNYRNFYMSRGRINISLACQRNGTSGDIVMTVNGTNTDNTVEGTIDLATYLPSGNVSMAAEVTSRRTGECQPGDVAAEGSTAAQ